MTLICTLNVGIGRSFGFDLSLIEERLLAGGGVTGMFKKYQKELFRVAMAQQAGGSGSGRSTPRNRSPPMIDVAQFRSPR